MKSVERATPVGREALEGGVVTGSTQPDPTGALGPHLRVAVCRRAGRMARVAAAEVAAALQAAGCTAVQLDARPAPHTNLTAEVPSPAAYDIVLVIGDDVETARPLAEALRVPLVLIPIPIPTDVERLVTSALLRSHGSAPALVLAPEGGR